MPNRSPRSTQDAKHQPDSQPHALSVDAHTLGQMLGVHKNTIEKLREDGVLPCVKWTERCIRYPIHQVIAVMDRLANFEPGDVEGDSSQA